MKKNDNGGFKNISARKFDDPQKIKLMSESEIYDILNEDIDIIITQITNNRNQKGKYPKYVSNMFFNISSAKYMHEYIKKNIKALDKDEKKSLKTIISQAYKESKSKNNKYQISMLDNTDRDTYLRDAFKILSKKQHKVIKKFLLDKTKTKELLIYTFMEPKFSMRQVVALVDQSNINIKKKKKLLEEIYGKRYYSAIGTSLTVEYNSSEMVQFAYDTVMKAKYKHRYKYIEEYAIAFKKIENSNFLLKKDFYDKNRKIIKSLIKDDAGYKKAFNFINAPKKKEKTKKHSMKDKDFKILNDVYKRVRE